MSSDSTGEDEGARIGRYRLLELLGEGGMGVVHRAYDEELDRMVALKLVRASVHGEADTHDRLLREGRAIARLHHPHVVKVHDVGVADGRLFLAMELVRGPTLKDWLAADTRDWRDVLRILVAAGEGLAAAHGAGIVHRDFKPANVLIGDGRVKVADFGLARSVDVAELAPASASASTDLGGLTQIGTVLGTPAYMAPEQHLGESPGPLADQFAFCVVLWEAIHGERPFTGASLQELVSNIAHGRTTAQRRPIPPWLRAVIMRGLSPEPGRRHRSMEALLRELRRAPMIATGKRVAIAATIVVALAGGLGAQRTYAERRRCEEDAVEAVSDWSAANAPTETVTAKLTADARSWQALWQSACAAGAVDDSITRCFAAHGAERAAYLEVLASADDAAQRRSMDALAVLHAPAWCGRTDADAVEPAIARARVLVALARFDEAERAAATAIPGPNAAEGWLTRALAEEGAGRADAAVHSLWEAAWAAEASARDRAGAEAWVHLARLSDDHERIGRLAADAIARAGGDDDLSRALAFVRADAAVAAGRSDDAAAILAVLPNESSSIVPELVQARALLHSGRLRLAIAQPDEAASDLVRALALAGDVYGPAHPSVAEFHAALADALGPR